VIVSGKVVWTLNFHQFNFEMPVRKELL